MYCPQCNSHLPDEAHYCPHCGANDARYLEEMPVECPECGKYSDSIKCYRLPDVWVFLFVYLRWATRGEICCPECMRKKILIHGCTYNIVSANFLWPFILLPWSVIQFIRTFSKGHSSEVLDFLREQNQ